MLFEDIQNLVKEATADPMIKEESVTSAASGGLVEKLAEALDEPESSGGDLVTAKILTALDILSS